MNVLCLDLEGVLIPEIWEVIAEVTEIEEFCLPLETWLITMNDDPSFFGAETT
ncbi:MAG: hypothetical protein Ct9H300mP8_12070 [Gammaproteobacteria bacterium]|nr:MAG: hypothetical protein Ct9H300mP8_12070 [Gammaproteobacteria bacterium]